MTGVRRSQAERSAATREALLDAAIGCLIDEAPGQVIPKLVEFFSR